LQLSLLNRRATGPVIAEHAEIEGMNRALSTLLLRLAVELALAGLAYGYLRSLGLYGFTAPEANGLAALMLLLGSIYAVMFAFVIFVIWDQFTDVENIAMRECNSLDISRASANISARMRAARSVGPWWTTHSAWRGQNGRASASGAKTP
jgi:hypothetical protein